MGLDIRTPVPVRDNDNDAVWLQHMDPATREAFQAFRGRDPHPTGAGEPFYCIQQPRYPEFRFEWHPQKRKLYLVRLNHKPLIGEIIAEHVETHGQAFGFVQTWLRGYQAGQTPGVPNPNLEG
jgi:hypothetical protein